MKRVLAILLLLIHLFNLSGYALVFRYLMIRSYEQQAQQIDAGKYDRDALVILKVPMQLPYSSDWAKFERAEGSIEIEGINYTYVERKISRDTVYLACLPNEEKTILKKAETEFAKSVHTAPEGKQKSRDFLKKGVPGMEYNEPAGPLHFALLQPFASFQPSFPVPLTTPGYLLAPDAPPDLV